MPTIRVQATTPVAAATIRAELTNFTDLDRRLAAFRNLDRRWFRLHELDSASAVVTEGSSFAGGVWERVRYDWSDPDTVSLTVLESNAFAAGSSWTYTLHTLPEGGTRVVLRVDRRPRTPKGRLLALPLTLFGRAIFRADLQRTLDHLGTMNHRPTA